jgi:hypothetical protein
MFACCKKKFQGEIQVLHRQGNGIGALARETGVARSKARAILAGKSYSQLLPGPASPNQKIDALKIRAWASGGCIGRIKESTWRQVIEGPQCPKVFREIGRE